MNFRRFGKYICAMGLAVTLSVNVMGATIADVNDKHWAYEAVTDLEERGIMVLTSSGQFYPNQTMNYFELADVIAKATGYVDVDVATNVTDTFKQQVKANYEKQMKEVINEYASKYKTWNNAYNQQVAYVLGRGYMKKSDLDKFITKTDKGETKNIATKEELCVYLVKMLQKADTAASTYKTTSFKDDSTLQAANKPYVAYLASLGIVTANSEGKVNGTMKMTKALCAKMVSDTLKIKDTTQVGRITNQAANQGNNETNTNTNTNTNSTTENANGLYTVQRVLNKNTTEYYVGLKDAAGSEKFYSLKNTTKILDAMGVEMPITKLTSGTMVNATLELQEGTTYITSIKVAAEVGANTQTNTTSQDGTSVSGLLSSPISNGIIRMVLNDGSSKVYLIKEGCIVTLDGAAAASTDVLKAGDLATLTLENNAVTKITAITGQGLNSNTTGNNANNNSNNTNNGNTVTTPTTTAPANTMTSGELLAKKYTGNGYVLSLREGNVEGQVTVPTGAKITRNGKTMNMADVRIGDTIKLTSQSGAVSAVAATGEKKIVEGTIKSLCIGGTSQVTITTKGEDVTYTLASDTEYYDGNTNTYINIRDLHIGQEVTISVESKEVITLDVEKNGDYYKYMGTITSISRGGDYIEVLVDYDYVTGESKVYKRIQTPSNLEVMQNGQRKNRNSLTEDMDVLIYYKYLDDTVPEKIHVL